mgnify:CR=1 FL=1
MDCDGLMPRRRTHRVATRRGNFSPAPASTARGTKSMLASAAASRYFSIFFLAACSGSVALCHRRGRGDCGALKAPHTTGDQKTTSVICPKPPEASGIDDLSTNIAGNTAPTLKPPRPRSAAVRAAAGRSTAASKTTAAAATTHDIGSDIFDLFRAEQLTCGSSGW